MLSALLKLIYVENGNICRLWVNGPNMAGGTESCSRPHDCELRTQVVTIRKRQLRENLALFLSVVSHQNYSLSLSQVANGFYQLPMESIINISKLTFIISKRHFEIVLFQLLSSCTFMFSQQGQGWPLTTTPTYQTFAPGSLFRRQIQHNQYPMPHSQQLLLLTSPL